MERIFWQGRGPTGKPWLSTVCPFTSSGCLKEVPGLEQHTDRTPTAVDSTTRRFRTTLWKPVRHTPIVQARATRPVDLWSRRSLSGARRKYSFDPHGRRARWGSADFIESRERRTSPSRLGIQNASWARRGLHVVHPRRGCRALCTSSDRSGPRRSHPARASAPPAAHHAQFHVRAMAIALSEGVDWRVAHAHRGGQSTHPDGRQRGDASHILDSTDPPPRPRAPQHARQDATPIGMATRMRANGQDSLGFEGCTASPRCPSADRVDPHHV